MTLTDFQKITKPYADARGELAEIVSDLTAQIEALKRAKMSRIKELVAKAAEKGVVLRSAIEAHAELFQDPRTVIFYGIKIGMQKGRGGIEWDDDDRVLQLIRKHYGEESELIRRVEKPDKRMLKDLPVDELKRVGCRVVNTTDEVVCRPVNDEVDKLVDALLQSAIDD